MELKEKIIDLVKKYDNDHTKPLIRKPIRLLKMILVDEETDIDIISKVVPIGIHTIEKYREKNELIEVFLTKEEYELFKQKVNYILNLNKQTKLSKQGENKTEELEVLSNIIYDIFNTRYKLDDICIKNYLSDSRFRKILLDENYLDERFGKGTRQKIKERLNETRLIRTRCSRNEYVIEDEIQLLIVKPNITHLNPQSFKELSLAASYLDSGADAQYITKAYNSSFSSIVASLFNSKLSEILKEEYYLKLMSYINIERIFLGNNIVEKHKFIYEIIQFLSNNKFDKKMAIEHFKIPANLFERILEQAIGVPYIEEDIKIELKNILNIQKEGEKDGPSGNKKI